MPSEVIIYNRNGFVVASYDNGWAYLLTRAEPYKHAWFQDENATRFRAEFDAAFEHGDNAVSRVFSDYL